MIRFHKDEYVVGVRGNPSFLFFLWSSKLQYIDCYVHVKRRQHNTTLYMLLTVSERTQSLFLNDRKSEYIPYHIIVHNF